MLYRGTFLDIPSLGAAQILKDHILAIDSTGTITHFAPATSPTWTELLPTLAEPVVQIPDGTFIMPTFCDLHLHAPQFLYQGTGLHLPLMQWLDEYAFKAEERLDADPALARKVYERLAERLIENGTGTVLLFGTIREETNLILAEVMQNAGIRAFVGKLSMDISSRPSYVESSAEKALASASSFIRRCSDIVSSLPPHQRLIEPVLTPRFVPTCSDELLEGLGKTSKLQSVKVQSHLAEAHDQVDWVRKERGAEDIDVFDRVRIHPFFILTPKYIDEGPQQHQLLTPRTIQAHCTFLSTTDLSRVASRGTSIAHCPLSNAYFSAEPFHLREALQQGVKVGLGTDVAGGYSLDIMSAMRQAVAVSRMREGARILAERVAKEGSASPEAGIKDNRNLSIDWKESLYLATVGGMQALGLGRTGSFEVGAPFDAQHIRVFDGTNGRGTGALDFLDLEASVASGGSSHEVTIEMIEKWWCLGGTENRLEMWVQGKPLIRRRA